MTSSSFDCACQYIIEYCSDVSGFYEFKRVFFVLMRKRGEVHLILDFMGNMMLRNMYGDLAADTKVYLWLLEIQSTNNQDKLTKAI